MVHYSTQLIWTPVPGQRPLKSTESSASHALVASLGRWHMRWFLALAARQQLRVAHYSDTPAGWLDSDGLARLTLLRLRLQPKVRFAGDVQPDAAHIEALHTAAQAQCQLGNGIEVEIFHRRRRIAASQIK